MLYFIFCNPLAGIPGKLW